MPFRQKSPLVQGVTLERVVGDEPSVYSPGRAGTGLPLPSGQYLWYTHTHTNSTLANNTSQTYTPQHITTHATNTTPEARQPLGGGQSNTTNYTVLPAEVHPHHAHGTLVRTLRAIHIGAVWE